MEERPPDSPVCYTAVRQEATITISDELAEAIEAYRRDQDEQAGLPAIAEAALKHYLQELDYVAAAHPLRITPAPVGSGKTDVSVAHDRELAAEGCRPSLPTQAHFRWTLR